jgi:hypothetical protein
MPWATVGRSTYRVASGSPRAYASTVHMSGEKADVGTGEDAARRPLSVRWVTTVWRSELHRVVRAAVELTPWAGVRVPA